jgi:pyruvate/2-oxoglutarate dehydrogenase complex dihydrolipoamide dehydrogenase (E3) component
VNTPSPLITPLDKHNEALIRNVHPPDWHAPTPASRYNLLVIGAGTAGLVSAAGAAGLGARVALVEQNLLGGDCLNVGCVPSKCIIRSSRVLGDIVASTALGVRVPPGVDVDFGEVMRRMRRLRAGISRNDSVERFTRLGVDVFLGPARFVSRDAVEVDGLRLRFAKAVIATGARAAHPPIPGLTETGFLTNETVFSLTERPRRIAVIGGGPIGCELAQAFRRLGSDVVLFHDGVHLLDREDSDAAEIVQRAFVREDVRLVLSVKIVEIRRTASGKVVHFEATSGPAQVEVDEILVAAGRAPNVDGLGLEVAGVRHDRQGVQVDDHLMTTNSRIYAAGDICMERKFTHTADASARIVIQNALFMGRKRLSAVTIPWCTYTDPEVAHVGLGAQDAAVRGIAVDTYVREWKDVDRAIADGEDEGFVKIHTRKGRDQIVGATIVARHAGEMIGEIAVAMASKTGLGRLAAVVHPYPTQAEAIRQVGDMYNRTRLTPFVKGLFVRWLRWTR